MRNLRTCCTPGRNKKILAVLFLAAVLVGGLSLCLESGAKRS